MNPDRRPSLAQLRARVQKQHHREIGNWLARRVARPSAVYGTWLAVRVGLSAHHVTALAMIAVLGSSIAIGTGTRIGFVVGVALAHLAFWLDHVDGQVARWNGRASLDGVFFDYLLHHFWNMTLGFALGLGLAFRTGDPLWSVAGFAIALGWLFLNLSNDCRYKAFFQRLKSHVGSFLVEGGRGGRPAPAAGWPRRGWGLLTWPAYKCCEPHVVLLALSSLALVALRDRELWSAIVPWMVRGMSVLAPTLAGARLFRMIVRRDVEREFQRWFEPLADAAPAKSERGWTSTESRSSLVSER